MDLFGSPSLTSQMKAPAWRDLPAETRAALTTLMARLILEHAKAGETAAEIEAGHDL